MRTSVFGYLIPALLWSFSSPVLAQDAEPVLQKPIAVAKDAASRISSVFASAGLAKQKVAPCCGVDCPPGACDAGRMLPTDLAYAYPAPTVPAHPTVTTKPSLPCCGLNCFDGGCRTATPHTTTLPDQFLHKRRRSPLDGTPEYSVLLGCPWNCDQDIVTRPGKTSQASIVSALLAPKRTAGAPDICIGCNPCIPCDQVRAPTYVTFKARPEPTGGDSSALLRTSTPVTATSSTTSSSSSNEAATTLPPIYMGDDVIDSINGRNQDTVNLAVHAGDANHTLLTIIATVDLKLSQNYISRRMLSRLNLLEATTSYPKGLSPSTAVLSNEYTSFMPINATIVLDIVIGSGPQLAKNVRFNLFGDENDDILTIPDVLVGTVLLRELGGLTTYSGIHAVVEQGDRVVYPIHEGEYEPDGSDEEDEKVVKHEEL